MRNRLTITKTTTALATSALLVLGLAACGGSGDDTSTDSETTTTEESASTEDESTDSTDSEEPAEEDGDAAASGDFCDAYNTLTASQSALSDAASDPAQAVTALDDLATSLEAAEAPAEISGDWDAVTGYFRQIADMTKAAVDDPANADPSALMDMMGDEGFMTSAQNVSVYATQNC